MWLKIFYINPLNIVSDTDAMVMYIHFLQYVYHTFNKDNMINTTMQHIKHNHIGCIKYGSKEFTSKFQVFVNAQAVIRVQEVSPGSPGSG